MLALLARFRTLLPAAAVAGLVLLFYVQHERLAAARADARAAEARVALAEAAYQSALTSLTALEVEAKALRERSSAAVEAVKGAQVKTVEKIVYLSREPEPSTCPDAIALLVRVGEDLEGGSQ